MSSSSCGNRRRYEPSFRRTFDYHRRQLAKQDAMDTVLATIANKFDKWSHQVNRNALVRQQGRRNLFDDEASWNRPYSVEDFGEAGMELSLKVPGVEKDDISVELEKETNLLVISGRRSLQEEGFLSQSEFSHSFRLDDDIDVDGIESMLESGILTISLPRKQKETVKETRKKIPITFAEDTGKDAATEDRKADDQAEKNEAKESHEAKQAPKRENKRTDERWDDDFVIFEDDPDEWV